MAPVSVTRTVIRKETTRDFDEAYNNGKSMKIDCKQLSATTAESLFAFLRSINAQTKDFEYTAIYVYDDD